MFEDARHFKGDRRHARNGEDGTVVDVDEFLGALVHDEIARRGATIACDQHAVLVFDGEDRGAFGGDAALVHLVLEFGRGGLGEPRRHFVAMGL